MPITKPTLPGKYGYVETVDEYGKPVYKEIKQTMEMLEQQEKISTLQETVDLLVLDALGVSEVTE